MAARSDRKEEPPRMRQVLQPRAAAAEEAPSWQVAENRIHL